MRANGARLNVEVCEEPPVSEPHVVMHRAATRRRLRRVAGRFRAAAVRDRLFEAEQERVQVDGRDLRRAD